jgi:hypothetical protein
MAAGVGALVFSTPAVFVLAGVVATLAISRVGTLRLALMAGAWSVVFAIIYVGITRPESATPYMRTFWSARFIPPSTWSDPRAVWNVVKRLPAGTLLTARGTNEPTLLLWALAALGVWRLGRQAPERTALVLAPVAAMLAAAGLSLYPISPRLDLFAAPIAFLLLGAAWEWGEDFGRGFAFGSRGLACLLIAGLALTGLKLDPWAPAIRSIAQVPLGHAPVYIYSAAIPAWAFYTTDWTNPDAARVRAIVATQGFNGESFHNAAGRGRAVSDTEGAKLVVNAGTRRELLGLAPGIQYREGAMFSQSAPDPGWARREADRVRGAGATVWVVAAPSNSPVVRELLDTLRGRGAKGVAVRTDHQAALYQLQFQP